MFLTLSALSNERVLRAYAVKVLHMQKKKFFYLQRLAFPVLAGADPGESAIASMSAAGTEGSASGGAVAPVACHQRNRWSKIELSQLLLQKIV